MGKQVQGGEDNQIFVFKDHSFVDKSSRCIKEVARSLLYLFCCEVCSMKISVLALMTLFATSIWAAPRAKAQSFIFGQPTSVQATPFNAFFLPTAAASSSSFFPPTGFYQYFWLPQYTIVYNQLYSDFQYDLPEGKVSYDFTIIKSFEY